MAENKKQNKEYSVDNLFHIFPYTKKYKPFLDTAKKLKILGFKEADILNAFDYLYDKYINNKYVHTKTIPLRSDLVIEGMKQILQQHKWNRGRIEYIITGEENCKCYKNIATNNSLIDEHIKSALKSQSEEWENVVEQTEGRNGR